jgi:iron complex outermembrane receptor protein
LTIVPMSDLQFGINYVFTDAPTTPVRNIFSNQIENISPAFTPRHAVTVSADYTFPRFSFGELRLHLDANTAGDYIPNNTVTQKADLVYLVNGRITLGDIDIGASRLELSLWGQNLTNATYNYLDFRVVGRQTFRLYNDPRTFGIQARVRF